MKLLFLSNSCSSSFVFSHEPNTIRRSYRVFSFIHPILDSIYRWLVNVYEWFLHQLYVFQFKSRSQVSIFQSKFKQEQHNLNCNDFNTRRETANEKKCMQTEIVPELREKVFALHLSRKNSWHFRPRRKDLVICEIQKMIFSKAVF